MASAAIPLPGPMWDGDGVGFPEADIFSEWVEHLLQWHRNSLLTHITPTHHQLMGILLLERR